MKKIVFTFGTIAGLICGGMFFLNAPDNGEIDFTHGALYGYISMIIALSTIFFAVRQYRDNYNDGQISFVKAFLIGLYITLVASVIYVIAWEIFYKNYAPDFGDQYVQYLEEQMLNEGLSATSIAERVQEQKDMMLAYKENTAMRMGITFLEIFPVGFVISLISAFLFGMVLKKKDKQLVIN